MSTFESKQEPIVFPDTLLNQTILRGKDTPIIPDNINITPEKLKLRASRRVKIIMKGESLHQLEESQLLAPRPPESKREKATAEVKKKRGFLRKNTKKMVA
jgi:hypothetical protein